MTVLNEHVKKDTSEPVDVGKIGASTPECVLPDMDGAHEGGASSCCETIMR